MYPEIQKFFNRELYYNSIGNLHLPAASLPTALVISCKLQPQLELYKCPFSKSEGPALCFDYML